MLKEFHRNILYVLRIVIRLCPSLLFANIFIAILGSSISAVGVLLLKYILDSLLMPELFYRAFVLILLNAIAAVFFFCISHFVSNVLIPKNTQILQKKLQSEIFHKVVDIEIACYENPDFYNRFSLAFQQADSRILMIVQVFSSLTSCLFGIGAFSALILSLDPKITYIILLYVTLTFFFDFRRSKIQHQYIEETTSLNRELLYIKRIYYLEDYAKDLRFFPISSALHYMFNNTSLNLLQKIKEFGYKFFKLESIHSVIQVANNATILLYLTNQVLLGLQSIGDFTALVSSSQQLSSQLTSLFGLFPKLFEHSLFIKNYREFMEYKSKITGLKNGLPIPENAKIDLCNVTFHYHDDDQNNVVLKEITLQILPGEHIAIVGRNGSGKTTLIKLIVRLYDPSTGELRINGIPYQEYSLQSLYQEMGVIYQDYHYYALTVAENILMRRISEENRVEDEALVIQALKTCGLYGKIQSQPKGIYTKLTREFDKDGIFLSGGEMQKLAIARLFAKNSSFIILDEPASSLDPVAEKELYDLLYRISKGKTVIMVSHRLSSIIHADRILFMDNGMIVEQGTHEELMRLNGKYAKMFKLQAEKYTIHE